MSHADIPVPRETEVKLRSFLNLLRGWNTRINLVGKTSTDDWWTRHVLDSLQLVPLLPDNGPILDLGSGAGFPGIVLALATDRAVHLIEADRRKAAFLMEAVRVLKLETALVHNLRIDAAPPVPATVVTARALAPLTDLLRHAHRMLPPGGVALFPKGRSGEHELTAAAAEWHMRVERFPSRTDSQSVIFRISEISPAGAKA